MIKRNQGGNPLLDRKDSMERFTTIVEPVFLRQGFKRMNLRSQILINDETKTIVFVTSSPSQVTQPNDYKVKIKEFRKKYEGYSPYILFTRDYTEWRDKPIYLNTLKKVMAIPNLNGIVTGLGNLTQLLKSSKNSDQLYMIG